MDKKKEERAMSQPKLVGEFQLGDLLGKGGFGTVYKALNNDTGEYVAVKQLPLRNMAKDQIASIQSEIDLLKKLNHEHIVKYIDNKQTKDFLYIVIEFVENGSLQSVVKKFGTLKETVVASYTEQLLEGLKYLHEEGVIHRDIKGANLLVTKDGTIKLADFGVAAKLADVGDQESVVGTPYWMAPEIIELNPPTTASDIWSVGCTIIELLSGSPPYFELAAMPALFRIVQDDHPPLPDNLSPPLKEFLLECFRKDPNLRLSAAKLLKHAWLKSAAKKRAESLPPGEAPAVRSRKPSIRPQLFKPGDSLPSHLAAKPKIDLSAFEENEDDPFDDLDFNSKNTIKASKVSLREVKLSLPDDWVSDDTPKQQQPTAAAKSDEKEKEKEKMSESSPLSSFSDGGSSSNECSPKAPQPAPVPTARKVLPGIHQRAPSSLPVQLSGGSATGTPKNEDEEEDGFDDIADAFEDAMKSNAVDRLRNKPSILVPGGRKGSAPSIPVSALGLAGRGLVPIAAVAAAHQKRLELAQYREEDGEEEEEELNFDEESEEEEEGPLNLQQKLKAKMKESWDDELDIEDDDPFADLEEQIDEEEDRDAQEHLARQREEKQRNANDVVKCLSFLKTDIPEDQAAGACNRLTEIFTEHSDLKSYLISHHGTMPVIEILEHRDQTRHVLFLAALRTLNKSVENNPALQETFCLVGIIPTVSRFSSISFPNEIRKEAASFISLMLNSPLTLQMFIACRGLACLVEFLDYKEPTSAQDLSNIRDITCMAVDGIIQVFNIPDNPTPKNDFCRLFTKSNLLKYLSRVLQNFVIDREIVQTPTSGSGSGTPTGSLRSASISAGQTPTHNLRTISSGGSLSKSSANPFGSVKGASSPGTPGSSTPGSTLPSTLSTQSHSMNARLREYTDKIATIFQIFSSADSVVKVAVAGDDVLTRIRSCLRDMPPEPLVKLVRCIKNLTLDQGTLESLQKAGMIPFLVGFLQPSREGFPSSMITELHNQSLSALFYLCKVNKTRQELAASSGIIPHLQRFITTNNPLKQFALPMICELAHASKRSRAELWKYHGVEFYLDLIKGFEFLRVTALEAIFVWLNDEKNRVQAILKEPEHIDKLINAFHTASPATFENLLGPFEKIILVSKKVNRALGTSGAFVQSLVHRLQQDQWDAIVRLNMLKILRLLYEFSENPKELVMQDNLYSVVQNIAMKDKAILVNEMANNLLKAFGANLKF